MECRSYIESTLWQMDGHLLSFLHLFFSIIFLVYTSETCLRVPCMGQTSGFIGQGYLWKVVPNAISTITGYLYTVMSLAGHRLCYCDQSLSTLGNRNNTHSVRRLRSHPFLPWWIILTVRLICSNPTLPNQIPSSAQQYYKATCARAYEVDVILSIAILARIYTRIDNFPNLPVERLIGFN